MTQTFLSVFNINTPSLKFAPKDGDRVIGRTETEIEGRIATVAKVKSGGRLTLIFDDAPDIEDTGYLDEEVLPYQE